jgi:zinc protease
MGRKLAMLFFICFFIGFNAVFINSQVPESQEKVIEKLIRDPALRYGKLENGLTYYIRHNEMPKERAEFYIVQNVGSNQEDENQRGLAHFLEHMAFNGSKNFPSKNGIQDYTESIGMSMGDNLNAYTGFDETVYMLMNVPVVRKGIVDSSLLILHDWSSFLLLGDESIEKERGVIREEWRSSSNAQLRIWEQQLPVIFPDNKYGKRLPIGKIDVINNFKGDELRAYYEKWYRPDLQAIIIAGDIDVDYVESKIKDIFSDIKAPVNPEPLEKVYVPDNLAPIVSIAKDKELTNTTLSIYYKHDKIPWKLKGTIADFITSYSQMIVSIIMSERFSDILQKANPPFVSAYANDEDFIVSNTKAAWTSTAIVKQGNIEMAMNALVAETERVKNFGFTEAEYSRAKENVLKSYESLYNDRDKHKNSSYANEYVRNFTTEESIPGIENEYQLTKQVSEIFTVGAINNYVKTLFDPDDNNKNIVISLSGPDKEGVTYPTEKELFEMFINARGEVVQAIDEELINVELVTNLPVPGKIVKEDENPLFGVRIYTLSNGAKVIVKQTRLKEDQIVMKATSPGGLSLFKDKEDIYNAKVINNTIMLGGLGAFSAGNLRKALSGKNIECSAGFTDYEESITGVTSPSDLKTLFEIIYLQFTSMRIDQNAYLSFEERVKSQLDNLNMNPDVNFSDTISDLLYNGNIKNKRFKSVDFENVNYIRTIAMYNERFADASDFIFTFVGNVNIDSIKPLIEQYIATLPSLNRKEQADESQITPFQKGRLSCNFTRLMETPKSTVGLIYTGKMPYTLKNAVISQLLSRILDLVYTEKVRGEESASYGVQSEVALYDFPKGRMSIQIFYETNPERQNEILNIVKSELKKIAKEGPSETDLIKSRDNIIKSRQETMQENEYWLEMIDTYYNRGYNPHTEFSSIINSITADEIKAFTKEFLSQGNFLEVVMSPEIPAVTTLHAD